MVRTGLLVMALALLAGSLHAQSAVPLGPVEIFREARDREFRNPAMSPLRPEDVRDFKGLAYFAVDSGFVVKARFEKAETGQTFRMPTSIGTTWIYAIHGYLIFEIGGRSFRLSAYLSESQAKLTGPGRRLFVPFRDLTNGRETYGGGRFLDLIEPSGEEVRLDFNLAYNPSCAYGNDRFSCPLPPKENSLDVEVRAGEKAFLPKEPK